jgi:hypothetical protein
LHSRTADAFAANQTRAAARVCFQALLCATTMRRTMRGESRLPSRSLARLLPTLTGLSMME